MGPRPVMSVLTETAAKSLEATPNSAHAALLLFCPIFTCVILYVTRVSTHTCTHTHAAQLHATPCLSCGRDPYLHGWDSCLMRCCTLTRLLLTTSVFFFFFFVLTSSSVPLCVTTLCLFFFMGDTKGGGESLLSYGRRFLVLQCK